MSDLLSSNIGDYLSPHIAALAKQKEEVIRVVLDDLVPRWTIPDIARRCTFVRYAGNPNEYLLLDGKPIMEFFPLEQETLLEDGRYVVRFTQKHRRLDIQEPPDPPGAST